MLVFLLFVYLMSLSNVNCCLDVSQKHIKIEIGESRLIHAPLYYSFRDNSSNAISLISQHGSIVSLAHHTNSDNVEINILGLSAGKSEISVVCDSNSHNETKKFLILVQVHYSGLLENIAFIFGWLYFLCWSICFYPQLYQNFKTKSVVGLNFDTVMFGLFGYLMYNAFNVAMTYSTEIQRQYSLRYPKGIPPVLTNDLVFSMHGVVATAATSYQCLVYYREKQSVSTLGTTIVALCCFAVASCAILAAFGILLWLDVVYLCSYIKMYGNVMLYFPQVYMNYRRSSTAGFSIMGVLIDMMGGIFSMVQLLMDGYNYDDWKAVFENPAKFGIGIMTLIVSFIFIAQHYILYPAKPKEKHLELKLVP